MEELIIIGAGATGRELASVIADINDHQPTWKLIGFLDDDPAKQGKTLYGVPVLGPISSARESNTRLVISIAVMNYRQLRRKIIEELGLERQRFVTIIHPSASISRFARVGAGTIIMQNVAVNCDTIIGEHVIIQYNVAVAHDVLVEDFVTIAPGATVNGFVILKEGVYVGAGSTIINGTIAGPRIIGSGALIGLGAVVLRDVPAAATVVGNPARPLPQTH